MLMFSQPSGIGLPMRTKPYRNDRIIRVIRELFFTGGASSFAHRFDAEFLRAPAPEGVVARELPEPMLALVATGVRATYQLGHHTNLRFQIYAAIHEWRTGTHKSNDFSADAFLDVYNGHILTMKYIWTERPRAFHLMMKELYNLARCCALS